MSYKTRLIRRLYATLKTLADQRGILVEELKTKTKTAFKFASITQLTEEATIQVILRLELEIIT